LIRGKLLHCVSVDGADRRFLLMRGLQRVFCLLGQVWRIGLVRIGSEPLIRLSGLRWSRLDIDVSDAGGRGMETRFLLHLVCAVSA